MTKLRWIPRTLLYATLLASVAAAWIVVVELNVPEPQLSSEGMTAFGDTVTQELNDIIDQRASALDEIDSMDRMNPDQGSPAGMSHAPVESDFPESRTMAAGMLSEDIATTSAPSFAQGFLSSPELDSALDLADSWYFDGIAHNTSVAENLYRSSMIAESDDFLRYLGYRTLAQTLGRDIIHYRTLESLQLHGIKTTLYQTETDTILAGLRESRASARAQLGREIAELDEITDRELSMLVDGLAESWMDDEDSMVEPAADMDVLDDIRNRLYGFQQVSLPIRTSTPDSIPALNDRASWLNSERELGTQLQTIWNEDLSS